MVDCWLLADKIYIPWNMTIIMDETLKVLMNLHKELEDKKSFLMMNGIQSLLVPVIENHRHEDVWNQMKRNASDALIEGHAQNFVRSIRDLYTCYDSFIKRLINSVIYVQNISRRRVVPPISDNSTGFILRNCFVEDDIPTIVQNSLSETGERISSGQSRSLQKLLLDLSSSPYDLENSVIPRDSIDSLKKEMKRLIAQIDKINSHIKEILKRESIFDYGGTSEDESEFYHG